MPGTAEYGFTNRARERFADSFPHIRPEESLARSVLLSPQQCKDFGLDVRAGWHYRYDNVGDIVLACGESGQRGEPVVITCLTPKRAWKTSATAAGSRGGLNGTHKPLDPFSAFRLAADEAIEDEEEVMTLPPIRQLPSKPPATEPTTVMDDLDKEMTAMQACAKALKGLPPDIVKRVLDWNMKRFGPTEE